MLGTSSVVDTPSEPWTVVLSRPPENPAEVPIILATLQKFTEGLDRHGPLPINFLAGVTPQHNIRVGRSRLENLLQTLNVLDKHVVMRNAHGRSPWR